MSTPDESGWVSLRRLHTRRQVNELSLVLTAVAIDNEVALEDGQWTLLVAAEDVDDAESQLDKYARENRPRRFVGLPLVTIDSGWMGAAGYLVVIWALPALAGFGWLDEGWRGAGRLQAGLVGDGQWWRTITALTVHVDLAHIVANSLFGVIFGLFVGRHLGSGFGWLLILLSGAFGNAINAWLRPETFSSVGASTATFAALAMGAAFVWRRGYFAGGGWRRAFAPMFGGIAMLALTGVGGERTDVVAHFAGFACGLAAGLLAASFDIRRLGRSGQYLSAGAALGLVVLAWTRAAG